MMAFDDLTRRIRLGEDSTLEFKRVLLAGARVTSPRREEFGDEIAAMVNGGGGSIVLGVDDKSRDILGIPLDRLDAVEGWVREICNDSVSPPVDAVIRKIELPGASGELVPLIRVDIDRSLFVHRSPGGYYRRIGSSKRELLPEVLARLFQERSQSRVIRFDESAVPRTSPEDLDENLVGRFLGREFAVTEEALGKLRIVAADESGRARITVGRGVDVHRVAWTVVAACSDSSRELCRRADRHKLSDRRSRLCRTA